MLTDLIELYKRPAVNQISGFCHEAEQLDSDIKELAAIPRDLFHLPIDVCINGTVKSPLGAWLWSDR